MKTCSKCGFSGEDELFAKKEAICKKCRNAYMNEWRKNNSGKVKKINQKWWKENGPRIKRKYRRKIRERGRKYIKDINDNYAIQLLTKRTNLTASDIRQYPELIEAKKAELQIKRLIKQN